MKTIQEFLTFLAASLLWGAATWLIVEGIRLAQTAFHHHPHFWHF